MAYNPLLNPHPVSGPLTDAQLRALAVAISGTVTVGNFPASQAVTGTFWQATQPVSGPLTDTQLRAAAISVSGTFFQATQPVSFTWAGLTDAQLRATPVPVSSASLPLPTGAATDASLTGGTQKTRITNGTVDAGMEPFGALQVNNGFQTLFYDSWSTSPIDTTDKWTVTGTTPTISGGNMMMVATASTYNAIQTKDAVRPNVGFSLVRNGFQIETATSTGAGRFWGLGTPATTPAPAVLAQNGVGYELDQATGALLAVTYSAGVRTTVATLTRPTDGAIHAYGLYFRVTQAYWVLDGVTVASASFPNVTVVELPALIVRQNAAAFTGTPAFTNIAHLTADTARQSAAISDPVIGTRQARVTAAGALQVSNATLPPLVAGTASIGTVQQAAITKAVQGTTGVTTQDLKDAGRVVYSASTVLAGVTAVITTEAMLSMVPVRDGVAAAAATSFGATAGKRWRIQKIVLSGNTTAAAVLSARISLRMNPTGAAVIGSPKIATASLNGPAAVALTGDHAEIILPDGFEISGTQQIGLGQLAAAITGTLHASIIGFEY